MCFYKSRRLCGCGKSRRDCVHTWYNSLMSVRLCHYIPVRGWLKCFKSSNCTANQTARIKVSECKPPTKEPKRGNWSPSKTTTCTWQSVRSSSANNRGAVFYRTTEHFKNRRLSQTLELRQTGTFNQTQLVSSSRVQPPRCLGNASRYLQWEPGCVTVRTGTTWNAISTRGRETQAQDGEK